MEYDALTSSCARENFTEEDFSREKFLFNMTESGARIVTNVNKVGSEVGSFPLVCENCLGMSIFSEKRPVIRF